MYKRLGFPLGDAKNLTRDLRELAPKETDGPQTRPVCPEYFLGAFNHRPLALIRAGFPREVLDEFEVGFDRIHSRAIYPIRSASGELHGVVGGAIFREDEPEYPLFYENQPKYLAYGTHQGFPFQVNPKWTLWNYHRIINLLDNRPLIVVEGFKALLWIRTAGFEKAVALCGTAYEKEQAALIIRTGSPVLLFLDNDQAGIMAGRKLMKDLRKHGSGITSVIYPRDVKQPDDLAIDEVQKCLNKG